MVLEETPFYDQQKYQCGPASLAMLLSASGVSVHPDTLAPRTYLPGRQGTLQLELLAACRQHNRIPYVINPDLISLIAELRKGRPVLVLQNLGLNILPAYHYAVVIGVLPPDNIVIRSGDDKRLVMNIDRFLTTWQKSHSWAMIALRPGQLPAHADPVRYIEAVSAFEVTGNFSQAEKSYMAAHVAWPSEPITLFALGNNYLSQAKYKNAERVFRKLLAGHPDHIAASNNLAETLARQGCYSKAFAVADQTALLADKLNSPLTKMVQQTRHEIGQHLSPAGHAPTGVCNDSP